MLRIVASHGPEDGMPVTVEITRHRPDGEIRLTVGEQTLEATLPGRPFAHPTALLLARRRAGCTPEADVSSGDMSPSMDNDQRSQQTERAKEWLEAMKARPPFGAFDEACARARLTDKQSAILREYLGPEEQERVRLYGYPWTLASSGESILARIANGLILWDRCTVTGPKRRFVQNMFGLHVEPHARAVRTDGFHITRRSQEFYSKLFEMEVISLFLVNGFAVALLDEAGPECIATRASLSVAVEAKLLDTDALLDTVFRHPPVPTREYVERLAANPIHSRTPEEQARLAEQFFRNFDRAIEQSTTVSADVAVMFIRVNWPLDDLAGC